MLASLQFNALLAINLWVKEKFQNSTVPTFGNIPDVMCNVYDVYELMLMLLSLVFIFITKLFKVSCDKELRTFHVVNYHRTL